MLKTRGRGSKFVVLCFLDMDYTIVNRVGYKKEGYKDCFVPCLWHNRATALAQLCQCGGKS